MVFKSAPLPGSFMIIGVLGFIASGLYWDEIGPTWAFTFMVFSSILFIASLLSIRQSVDYERKRKKTKKKK